MDLIPLNVTTSYSFLSSAIKLDKFFAELVKRKIPYVGFNDNNHLMAFPSIVNLSKSSGIKPLLGMKINLENNQLSLFIINEVGYKNLINISYNISKNNSNSIDFEAIKPFTDGIAAVLSSSSEIFNNFEEHALSSYLLKLDKAFNSNFYVGIECYNKDDDKTAKIRKYLSKHPFKSVAFPSIKYIKKDEQIKLKILDSIKNNTHLDFDSEYMEDGPYYLRSNEEYNELYTENEILETHKLALISSFTFNKKRGELMRFTSDNSADIILRNKCEDFLNKKNLTSEEYKSRLDYELNVIHKMGYDDYFLLVEDFVNYAKNHDILVGPGRGSAAGSLVAYSLNITEIDPLKYNLLFERFLNDQRTSMPDIDVDIEDTKRNEIINYLISKYGMDRVAQIATIQEIKAKQAIRDIGRVYDLNPLDIEKMSKLLINNKYSLMDSYNKLKPFRDFILSDVYYQKIFKLALKIEGLARQQGIHAAGVVINNSPLLETLPVFFDETTNTMTSQYEKDNIEDQGFLKMDILSLTNLSTIHLCLDLIKKNHGKTIKFSDIPIDDPIIFDNLINKHLNMGLFQIESDGMNNAISVVKPTCFDDIVALLALFRPGPMDQIQKYGRLKNSNKPLHFKHPEFEPILGSTFGQIVYQEQIMIIAQKIAGFNMQEADLFRRAISKKKASELEKMRSKFVEGCINKGYERKFAENIYTTIFKFAEYGFNKSHAVAYAVITARMAYLKNYYPQEFYISLLSAYAGVNETKFTKLLNEFKKLNIKMAVPHINKSQRTFVAEGDYMIMPFDTIKGLTTETISNIFICRRNEGDFKGLFDFVTKMQAYNIQENQIVKLIKAGAFDSFVNNRQAMLDKLPVVIKNAQILAKSNSGFLFGDNEITFDLDTPEDKLTKIFDELDLLGAMITYNPIKLIKKQYENISFNQIEDLKNNDNVNLMCIVSKVKTITTKKDKKPMAFMTVNDENGAFVECVVFPRTYEIYNQLIERNKIVIIKGKYESTIDKQSIIVDSMEEVKYE